MMKKNQILVIILCVLLLLTGGFGKTSAQTETEPDDDALLAMVFAFAARDPQMKEQLEAFNALPEPEKAELINSAKSSFNSFRINKRIKGDLGGIAGLDIVPKVWVDGRELIPDVLKGLTDLEYDEQIDRIYLGFPFHKGGNGGYVLDPKAICSVAILERYQITEAKVLAIFKEELEKVGILGKSYSVIGLELESQIHDAFVETNKRIIENEGEGGVVEVEETNLLSIETYWQQMAREIFIDTGKKVFGLMYCRECDEASASFTETKITGNMREVQLNKTKCFLTAFHVNMNENLSELVSASDMHPQLQLISADNYQNGQALIAISGDIHDPSSWGDVSCTQFLDASIDTHQFCNSNYGYNSTFIDGLFNSVKKCLLEKMILAPAQPWEYDEAITEGIQNVFNTPLSNQPEKIQVQIEKGDQQQVLKSGDFADGNSNFSVSIVWDEAAQQWKFSLNTSQQYLRSLGYNDPGVLGALVSAMDDLIRKAQLNLCEPGQVSSNCVKEALTFLQIMNINLQNIGKEGKIHPSMWSSGGVRHLLPTSAKWEPVVGGAIDGVAETILDVPMQVKTLGELVIYEEQHKALSQVFTEQGMRKMQDAVLSELGATLRDCVEGTGEKCDYTVSKASVGLVLFFFAIEGKAASTLDDMVDEAASLANKLEGAPGLQKYFTKLSKEGDAGLAKGKKLDDLLNKVDLAKLDALVAKVDSRRLDDFLADLADNYTLRSKLLNEPELVDSWRILDDAGRTALKVDPDVLTKLNKVLQNTKLDDFLPISTATRNITNKTELVEQIVKLQDEAASIVGKRMSGMGDLMDELDHFIVNFANKPGASEFIKELSESGGKMAGGSFVLKTLKNNADELGTVVKFESTIASQVDDIGDVVVDVITDKGVLKNVFNEFKNWRSVLTNRFSSFSKQFSGYLTNKNIGEFSYFFKKGVDGDGFNNLSELKTQVVNAFSSTAGRAELSNIPISKVRQVVDDIGLTETQKVQALIDHLDDIDNFEEVFKLID